MSANEKRNEVIRNNQIPSYSQSLMSGKRKRQQNDCYEKLEHKTCLINPIGRIQENQHGSRGTEEECIQMDAINTVTDQHREQVMDFIRNFINSFYLISTNMWNKWKKKERDETDCSEDSEQYF